MKRTQHHRALAFACVLALMGLGLMVLSLFDPRPLPVIAAMSVGQVFGTLSLAAFLYVVIADLRLGIKKALQEEDAAPH